MLFSSRLLLQAHKNCQNMTEIEAKVSYVKLARSLKTYGVSFFLVKVRKIASFFDNDLLQLDKVYICTSSAKVSVMHNHFSGFI